MVKRKQGLAILFAILLTSILCVCGYILNAAASHGMSIVSRIELEDAYVLGSEFTPPELVAEVDGRQVKAVHILYFPDGKAYRKASYTLSLPGKYTLEYRVESDNRLVGTVTENFDVKEGYYTLTGGGTAEFLLAEQLPYSDLGGGLRVSLAEKSEIIFNKPINIKDFTSADPIIELYIDPYEPQVWDFEQFEIRLTDIYNPDNYLTVSARRNIDEAQAAYIMAGLPGQGTAGGDSKIYRNNQYGTAIYGSFSGQPLTASSRQFSVRLDDESKWIYIGNLGDAVKVAGLADPSYFPSPWEGFTTGEVRVSIVADMYRFNVPGARFVITKIAGLDLSEPFIQSHAPEITLDTGEYGYNMPDALVGKPYPIPQALAVDKNYGAVGVDVKVFYNYANPTSRINISCANGTFTPNNPGYYTVVYSAADVFGMPAQRIIIVRAVEKLAKLTVQADIEGRVLSGVVGEKIPVVTGYTASGGSGKLSVTISVSGPDGNYEVDGGAFLPLEEGVYAVVYEVTDYIGQTGMSLYNIEAKFAEHPILTESPSLQDVYISGGTYVFPDVRMYDYALKSEISAGVKISVDSSAATELGADKAATVVTEREEGILSIIYYIDEYEISFERPIINANFNGVFNPEKYFICDGGLSLTVKDDCFAFEAAKSGGNGFTFANYLLAEDFSMRFAGIPQSSNFAALSFYFTDSIDPKQSVKISFENASPNAVLNIGGIKLGLSSGFTGASQTNEFIFGIYKNYVSAGGARYKISTTIYGEPFWGFESGKLLLRAEFEGVKGGSAIGVRNINGQPFNSDITVDRIKPRIVVLGDMSGTHDFGKEMTISRAAAADVFSPNVTGFTLTVFAPDNSIVTSKDGVKLQNIDPLREYTFLLEQEGVYSVEYIATDLQLNTAQYFYSFTVVKQQKPQLQLSSTSGTAKAGKKVNIPTATAYDIDGSALKVYRFLTDDRGVTKELTSGTFRAGASGEYRVLYMAVNSLGYVAFAEYVVTVK